MSKYNNRHVLLDDYVFDSAKEANRYKELKLLQQAGEITDLVLQPRFLLQEGFSKKEKRYRKIEYVADFMYYDKKRKKTVVEDAKGLQTDVFKIKHKLFEYKYKDLELEIIE